MPVQPNATLNCLLPYFASGSFSRKRHVSSFHAGMTSLRAAGPPPTPTLMRTGKNNLSRDTTAWRAGSLQAQLHRFRLLSIGPRRAVVDRAMASADLSYDLSRGFRGIDAVQSSCVDSTRKRRFHLFCRPSSSCESNDYPLGWQPIVI
jgi:hypothetical protein